MAARGALVCVTHGKTQNGLRLEGAANMLEAAGSPPRSMRVMDDYSARVPGDSQTPKRGRYAAEPMPSKPLGRPKMLTARDARPTRLPDQCLRPPGGRLLFAFRYLAAAERFGDKAVVPLCTAVAPAQDDVRARRVRVGSPLLTQRNAKVPRVGALSAPARPLQQTECRRLRLLLPRKAEVPRESAERALFLSSGS
jgi:hypothetical protein